MKSLPNRKPRFLKRSAISALAFTALGCGLLASACAPEASDEEHLGSSSLAMVAGNPVHVSFSSELNPKNAGWYTNNWESSITYKLDAQADLNTIAPDGAGITAINVYPGNQDQYIDGIGSSMEESTVFNLMRMSPTTRTNALKEMFTQDGWGNNKGINMTLSRICLGTSDFTGRAFYTYGSPVNIQNDINYNIISVLQQAKGLSPSLRFFGSPWSPPPSMKTSGSIVGGSLSSGQEGALGAYLRGAATAYAGQGLKLMAMTMQNEPLYLPPDYPGSGMADWQGRDTAKALRTELNNNGQNDVKIWSFDHNFAQTYPFMDSTANDAAAVAAIDGTAFHDYAGDPSTMTQVHNDARMAGKSVRMSERMVWGVAGADRIVQYFRNWAQSYNSWVMMLDSNKSPEQWSGVPDPPTLIQSASSPDTYWRTPEYYIMGQFSKYVVPGARRIDSDAGSSGSVTNVAFLNPSGEIVTVVVNQTAVPQTFKLLCQGSQVTATLPAKTVGTYRWLSDAWSGAPGIGATLQAESFYQSGGLVTGTTVGYFEAGDYMVQRDVNFTSATSLNMHVASGSTTGGGIVEARLDSPTGTLLGSMNVGSTGGWSTYVDVNLPFSTKVSGVHALVVRAASGSGGVVNSDYFNLLSSTGAGVTLQAEGGGQVGTQLQSGGSGTIVGFFDAGDSISFPNVNMSGVTNMDLRVAGANPGGVLEVRLDSPTGALLASYTMTSTGSWTTWATRNIGLAASSGQHTLYLKGASGGGIMNIDYVTTH